MLYKEWTTVRLKFGLYAVIYLSLSLIFVTLWSEYRFGFIWHDQQAYIMAHATEFDSANLPPDFGSVEWFMNAAPQAMYYGWLNIVAIATAVAGVLGGVDLVADEVDKGTLSFLLTKPVRRSQIYLSKVGANVLALAAACSLVSLPILILDQFNLRSINLWEGLSATLMAILIGAAVICLSGLVSVFTHTTIQSLICSIVVIFSLVFIFSYLTKIQYYYSPSYSSFGTRSIAGNSLVVVLLSGVVASLSWLGVAVFRRKEF